MSNPNMYIDWSAEAEKVRLTQAEYNERFDWFVKNGHLVDNIKGHGNRTRWLSWCAKVPAYCTEQDHNQINLYTMDEDYRLRIYYTNFDNSKNHREDGVSGSSAWYLVNKMFFERHGRSLQSGFGRMENKDNFGYELDTVNMALAPIIYTNSRRCDYILSNINKADVSSAYPYGCCFDLPDCHTKSIKRLAGVYPPTEEYPFAFYIKSGHMAIYKELDTYKDFRLHPLYCTRGKWNNELYGDKDITVLMKASKFNLDDIMMELYDRKADDPAIKTMMVAFIGYVRSTKSWQHHYMGHLSACVYARHIKRMLHFYDKIVEAGNEVEMISTDSICWQGRTMPEITTKEKRIGNFVSENEGARLLMLANGVYGLEEDGKIVCFKHQGTASEEITVKIEKLNDIKKLKGAGVTGFDKRRKKFVEIDPFLGVTKDI